MTPPCWRRSPKPINCGSTSSPACGPAGQVDVAGIAAELKSLEPSGETPAWGRPCERPGRPARPAPAALVILTDGITTDGPTLSEAAAYARRKGVPLFLIGLGSDQPVRDLKLSDLLVNDVVFVDDIVNFQFKLTAAGFQGVRDSRAAPPGGKAGGAGPDRSDRRPDGQPQEVRLPYRPKEVGRFRYRIQAEPHEGSLARRATALPGRSRWRKEKIRVLLAQAIRVSSFAFFGTCWPVTKPSAQHGPQDADVEHTEQIKASLRCFPSAATNCWPMT